MKINYKYIANISENELTEQIIIPCVDETNFNCILIKNANKKMSQNGYSTDNLEVKLNRVLLRKNNSYYFHIIRCKKTDEYSKQQFDIIYKYIFSKLSIEIEDIELASLIISLEEYFKTSPEKDTRSLQIGVFGELFAIKYLHDCGYKIIVDKFHTNFYSKHDIEISERTRLEVKATVGEKRIHHFRHNQIKRNDVDVFVCSVMLEESKEGVSLYEMFSIVKKLFINPDSLFALEKLMKKCNISEESQGICFNFEYALNKIKFYNSVALPKIDIDSVDGVSNIEYDVDCTFAIDLEFSELLENIGAEQK